MHCPTQRTHHARVRQVRSHLNRARAVRLRYGAAVTELAITIPIIALVVLSTIETCSMLFLKQSLRIAAYEGARVALVPGSKLENIEAGCNEILATRKVKSAVITVTPSNFDQQPYGTIINVKVNADCAENSLFVPWIFTGRSLTSEMNMMAER